jgi:hypothetical protein
MRISPSFGRGESPDSYLIAPERLSVKMTEGAS